MAVMTKSGSFISGPIQFDCTTYANMMISVIQHGSINVPGYIASTDGIGGTKKQLWNRWNLKHILNESGRDRKVFQGKDATEEILKNTEINKMYLVGCATHAKGGVGHYAILYRDKIKSYMMHAILKGANGLSKNNGNGGVYHDKISDFISPRIRKNQFFYLFGPI